MQKRSPAQKTVMELQDVVCDRCGKSCIHHRFEHDVEPLAETASFTAAWGYGSSKDGLKWEAEICEECADQIYEFIDNGAGPGVLVNEYLGEYNKETLLQKVEHLAQKHAGMSGKEFLARLEAGDDFEEIPENELRHVYYPARAILEDSKPHSSVSE